MVGARLRSADDTPRSYWTVSEVAKRFRVLPATVRRWVKDERLVPAVRRPGKRGAWLFSGESIAKLEAGGNEE